LVIKLNCIKLKILYFMILLLEHSTGQQASDIIPLFLRLFLSSAAHLSAA